MTDLCQFICTKLEWSPRIARIVSVGYLSMHCWCLEITIKDWELRERERRIDNNNTFWILIAFILETTTLRRPQTRFFFFQSTWRPLSSFRSPLEEVDFFFLFQTFVGLKKQTRKKNCWVVICDPRLAQTRTLFELVIQWSGQFSVSSHWTEKIRC